MSWKSSIQVAPPNDRGFSLLETVVAFAIMAMALGAIFNLFSRSTVSTVLGSEYGQAVELAQSLAAGHAPGVARGAGVAAENFAWTVAASPHGSGAGPLALERVAVEVTWPSRGAQRTVRLETLRPVTWAER